MRIAIAKIFQETDTFNPLPFTLDDFRRFGIYFGEELLDRFGDVGELGGFAAAAEAQAGPVRLLPLLCASSWAGGRWTPEAQGFLEEELVSRLRAALPVDGVFLSLHGAMAAQEVDDLAGHFLGAARSVIGPDKPLVASLDHHANITRQMVETADALVGYRECPHTDSFETGARAGELLFSALEGGSKVCMAYRKIPMLTPADKFLTSEAPLRDLFDLASRMEEQPDVLSVSLFPVQPWFDAPELGWTSLVVTDARPALAEKLAGNLAAEAWRKRALFFGADRVPPAEAVRRAAAAPQGPVILADGADNMNSGAPGDSTCLLREFLDQGVSCRTLLPMVDPEAVEAAIQAGLGNEVNLALGGKRDAMFSQPVAVTGSVRRFGEGKVRSTGHLPVDFDMGRTVLLEVGSIQIVLSQHPGPAHEPAVYQHLGLDPRQAQIVVVKTPVGFRVSYADIMKQAIVVDCPGLSTPHLETLSFVRPPRPIFPFEEFEWEA